MKYSVGILEDVLIKVGDLYVWIDFGILEMEEDARTPVILGRPFLAIARCRIDMKNGTLSFDVGDNHVEFNLLKAAKFPSISDQCNKIDVVNGLIWETMFNLDSNEPLTHLMLNNSTTKYQNPKVSECLNFWSLSTNSAFPC